MKTIIYESKEWIVYRWTTGKHEVWYRYFCDDLNEPRMRKEYEF